MEDEFGQEDQFDMWSDMSNLLDKDLQATLEPEVEKFLNGIRDVQVPELYEEEPQFYGEVKGETTENLADLAEEGNSPLSLNPFLVEERAECTAESPLLEEKPVTQANIAETVLSSTSQDSMQTRLDMTNVASAPHDYSIDSDDKYTGLSAVEIARRKAQNQAMESIGEKRKGSSDDEKPAKREKTNPNEPQEKVNQRRYQRRLQKNRDTAYISRIRRRAYTALLEESLTSTENEKRRLNGVVDSLTSEIATLKAELRGLYASRNAPAFSFGSDAKLAPGATVNNGQAGGMDNTPVMDLIKGMFRPIAPSENVNRSVEQMQTVPEAFTHSHKTSSSAGRGSVMLMFSLLFVITIPGLFYGSTVNELVTMVAPPQQEDIVAAVWMDHTQVGNNMEVSTYNSDNPVDYESYRQDLLDSKKLCLGDRYSMSEYPDSFECLQQGLDIRSEFGGYHGYRIIMAQ
eukprot:Plantae.Rhodophyta-Purpureofilum_apyrenoidigerum.ctg21653.p1 GENE.Plantae.Rhodophyta-Purpureofilum_apyrenoidigerum.ctg21653~~Plantae.Rhodophyta-Purpureofilum_apyrenoidigerum.ctg21653.p1  ORF type:complete len:459 (+),score=106.19 Plantae.Rhodophyta-Purpureofilum_apyrenoidigerum.ctg21653:120-1496(+)